MSIYSSHQLVKVLLRWVLHCNRSTMKSIKLLEFWQNILDFCPLLILFVKCVLAIAKGEINPQKSSASHIIT